jgi:hypothetical protein
LLASDLAAENEAITKLDYAGLLARNTVIPSRSADLFSREVNGLTKPSGF